MRIVIVGVGSMGEALLSGWLTRIPADELGFVETDEGRAGRIIEKYGIRRMELADAAAAQVVVLAVKPYGVVPALRAIAPTLDTLVVSIAAGVGLAALEEAAPGVSCIRVMPNTPALVGAGMAGIAAGANVAAWQIDLVKELLEAVGKTVVIAEGLMDAVTAVSGSGPAYLFYLAEAMIEAGVHLGLNREDARMLVTQTLLGAATMLERTGESATLLRERVTSPEGTTAAALAVLDERAVRSAIGVALRAARDRSRQMD